MNYIKIERASIGNGIGWRVVLWVSGCEHHCVGCHNPETHDFDSGTLFTDKSLKELHDAMNHEWISGITFSGGDPLSDRNIIGTCMLCEYVRKNFNDKTIWVYTGNVIKYSDFNNKKNINLYEILNCADVVVDGPYVDSERDVSLPFRGSRNQRLIDCKKTLAAKKIIEYGDETFEDA